VFKVPFESVDDIAFYVSEHYHHFGFRPDQIKLTPDMYFNLLQYLDHKFGPHNDQLVQFMGVDIKETEQVQDGTKHDVLAKWRPWPEA
jgi:hypothetical protein